MERHNLLLWCRRKCNNPKLQDEEDFSYVLDNIEEVISSVGITSESIDGLSQSFSSETHKEMMSILSPYRRAKFL